MANFGTFTNCGIFVGGYNITGRSNEVVATLTKDILDRSVFGVAARQKGTGLESAQISAKGFHDQSIDIERTYHGVDTPVSLFIPASGAATVVPGDRAIFFNALEAQYLRGAAFGEDAKFSFNAIGDQWGYPVSLGYVLNPGLVAVTADNTPAATIMYVGPVTAAQYLYAVLHITSVSTADSIVVKLQSAAAVGFADPVDRITFGSASAIGSQMAARVAGGITDGYWRAYADVTVTGEPCAITFACAMAIR